MKRNKIACQAITWTWSGFQLEEIFESVSKLGFDGIEMPSEFFSYAESSGSTMKEVAERYSLPIISVYQTARLGNRDASLRRFDFERAEALINLMQALGIQYLIIGDPPRNYGDDSVLLAETLNKLGDIARSKGTVLCYHPHRGSIIETAEQIEKLLKMTSPEQVSLCLDTGHVYWGGGDPVQVLRQFRSRVSYIHFKDVRKKPLGSVEKLVETIKSLKVDVDIRTKCKCLGFMLLETKGPVITEIGRGDIEFSSVVAELAASNYEGWITLELDAPTLVPEISLGRCLSHVNGLFTRAT